MVDVSRIHSGKLSIRPSGTELSDLFKRIVSDLSHQADSANFDVTLRADKVAHGVWDEFRVEQIIVNLLTNAFRYGSGKPVIVTLKTNPLHAEIAVRDQGNGITAADQQRIFEPFERATTKVGSGLGLYIACQLAEAHGGALDVGSFYGEGATFILKLPFRNSLNRC